MSLMQMAPFGLVGLMVLGVSACRTDERSDRPGDAGVEEHDASAVSNDGATVSVDGATVSVDGAVSDGGGASLDSGSSMAGAFAFSSGDPAASCDTPSGPWGISPGRLQQPWTIRDCDGNAYSLYNNDFCRARATVVILSAGWCGACRGEAPSMLEELVEPYSARGVRIMQVLQEDNGYGRVSSEFCHGWASQYGLEGVTFMDPDKATDTYSYRPGVDETPPSVLSYSLPVVRVYDASGTIRYVLQGGTSNWSTVTEALDTILAE